MRRSMTQVLGLVAASCLAAAPLPADDAEQSAPRGERVVVPFDLQSDFDHGRYGAQVGDMLWQKLDRKGGFVLPESMEDVRDLCHRSGVAPGSDTSLDQVRTLVRDQYGGDVGIWGRVERAPGSDEDVYDLWLFVAVFSVDPPQMLYQAQARTRTVSEIPHVYVRQALARLYGETPSGSDPVTDPAREERWADGPNLVQGDFELDQKAPAGWDPLPEHVQWVLDQPVDGVQNHIVRFTLPASVAETTGVLYYSEFFPVREGATYRFQCRFRSDGPAVKVFIKCYDDLPAKYRVRQDTVASTQRREVYRSQQNLTGPPAGWNTHTQEFTPRHTQYTPRFGRVMLYAYFPAGRVDWDDVMVKEIAPPPDGTPKDRRPSLETNATTEDVQKAR